MLSLGALRKLCAAFDAVALTIIAAGLSHPRCRPFSARAGGHSPPPDFPTIASCRAAVAASKRRRQASSPPAEARPEGPADAEAPVLVRIKSERDPVRLYELFKANADNRVLVENRFAFEDAVARLAGARRNDLVEEILEQHKALPQGRREGFVIRIIGLYGRARMPEHALRTFREMEMYGCERTVKSLNATMKVLMQARLFDEALQLLDEASPTYGVELDDISYNTVVKMACDMGELHAAYRVMQEMEKEGVRPDVITYTTLMAAFYKNGHREVGDGLWNLMRLRGCMPTQTSYNVRIQFLINRRRGWQANDLVRKMYAAGITPDEITYNLVIKGFFVIGEHEMAKTVFGAMHGRGCKPNERIYQTMVHYLCKRREFNLAFRLCKDSMEKNWFPSVDTIHNLLKGLMVIKKDRNAREIMKLVAERKPSFSVDDVKAFQDILSHGKTGR
ncbi:pentatricopeptide repeat-containing protein At1g80150, mitochondrial-like [Triticum dicoccoides]|uniref:pentatricopeptide repeat-containing protein At1g80150, mitochondrial-like n=1 Tax=Triticum dicoccoides TaxID=85692 RepID=UPI0018916EAF|nr:pentatricopeptide repeat-containing protein At1g80150, mitochondrial-like [Triticum dicoccoides]XP_037462283.1 pentatricopeptide repeat-containing protein At1g80150, mitochondrial-like [Triticum dicoccoides]